MPYYFPIDYRPEGESISSSYTQFAFVYKEALERLIHDFTSNHPIHDYSLAPAAMLLIHYIELTLKGVIYYCSNEEHKPIGTHDISYLYKKASDDVISRFGNPGKANDEVERFILLFGDFDKKSQALRYPETREGEALQFAEMDDWLYNRLCTIEGLIDISKKVMGDLDGIVGFIEFQLEREEETARNANYWFDRR